jgi:hypothetical protein
MRRRAGNGVAMKSAHVTDNGVSLNAGLASAAVDGRSGALAHWAMGGLTTVGTDFKFPQSIPFGEEAIIVIGRVQNWSN